MARKASFFTSGLAAVPDVLRKTSSISVAVESALPEMVLQMEVTELIEKPCMVKDSRVENNSTARTRNNKGVLYRELRFREWTDEL